jgi:mRNA interferase RelE/StbE
MNYLIEFSKRAEKQFLALPQSVQERLIPQINALAENPRPSKIKKLVGEENQYRIRVGDYRIVYQIQDQLLLIVILKIGHRSEVYRQR